VEAHNAFRDAQNDWKIISEESTVSCDQNGHCEFSVAFVRDLETKDSENDIRIERGEEREFALTGFYAAVDQVSGHITHVGQSNDQYVLMGAVNAMTSSLAVVAAAIITLSAF